MNKQIQVGIIFILLAALFFVNIPPPEGSDVGGGEQVQEQQLNLTPYTIQINETVNITNFEGKVVDTKVVAVNKTIIPEIPEEEKETNILTIFSNLGGTLWPSSPAGGWIIIFLTVYFVIIPILRWIKELIWG